MAGPAEPGCASPRVPWCGPPGHAQAGGARGDGAQCYQHPQHGAAEVKGEALEKLCIQQFRAN